MPFLWVHITQGRDRLCGRCAYIFISLCNNLIGAKYSAPQLHVQLLLWVVLAKGCRALACRSRRYFARSVQVVQKVVDLFEVTTAAQWACYSAPTAGVRVLESIQTLLHHAHIHIHALYVPQDLFHSVVHGLHGECVAATAVYHYWLGCYSALH